MNAARRFLILALVVAAAAGALGEVHAQAIDLEIGREFGFGGIEPAWYGLARINLHIAETFGQDLFLLPEVGAFLRGDLEGYARVQLVLDGPAGTFFVDGRYWSGTPPGVGAGMGDAQLAGLAGGGGAFGGSTGGAVRIGVRFGFDLGGAGD